MAALIDIVSSKVKAELFRLLFGLDRPELHLRELVRRSGLSLGTVQQEVRRLARVGIISARRDGNRLNYRANSDHPVFTAICDLVLKTDGLARVLKDALREGQIDFAFVFGSIARGAGRGASDIDLMVIGPIGLRRLTALLSGVGSQLGREINPHVLTMREFRERKSRHEHFITSVLKEPRIFVKGNPIEFEAMDSEWLAEAASNQSG